MAVKTENKKTRRSLRVISDKKELFRQKRQERFAEKNADIFKSIFGRKLA